VAKVSIGELGGVGGRTNGLRVLEACGGAAEKAANDIE
jgi:hypothetical protein